MLSMDLQSLSVTQTLHRNFSDSPICIQLKLLFTQLKVQNGTRTRNVELDFKDLILWSDESFVPFLLLENEIKKLKDWLKFIC